MNDGVVDCVVICRMYKAVYNTDYCIFSQRKDYFKNGIYSKGVLIIMASEHMRMMRRQRRCKPPPPPDLSFGDYAPPFHRPQ